MTTEKTPPTAEQKQQAAAALRPFFEKTTEQVFTSSLHVFVQADQLHIAFYGGEKMGFILNGNFYPVDLYREGTPQNPNSHRDKNAFVKGAIEVLKKAFKITTAELPESDFYAAYTEHMAAYLPVVEKQLENADLSFARPQGLSSEEMYEKFLEFCKKYPDGIVPDMKVPPPANPAKDRKPIPVPPGSAQPGAKNNPAAKPPRKTARKPAKKGSKKKASKKK